MATSNSSFHLMPKRYSGHFEELYNETVIKSPLAKLCSEELPRSKGIVHKYLLSPVAKIIQKMKGKENHKERAPSQQSRLQCRKDYDHPKHNNLSTADTKQQKSEVSISSFDCSDTSSEKSSDMSDDEQVPEKCVTPTVNGDKVPNLHRILQKHKSPEKQTLTRSLRSKQEQKTPTEGELHLPDSIKDLQKSLTPEFKAMAVKTSNPQGGNSMYRNKKIEIDERQSSNDTNIDEQMVDEDNDSTKEQFQPDSQQEQDDGDQSMMQTRSRRSDVPNTEHSEMTTPSTHLTTKEPDDQTPTNCQISQNSRCEQEDETPKNAKMSKSLPSSGEVILDNWFIQMVPKGKGIRMQGHRSCDPPDSFWNSSVITQRINKSTVTTKSGTVYKLKGRMDRASARDEGFNVKVVKRFYCGFPVNWKECLAEFMHEVTDGTSKPVRNKSVTVTPAVNTSQRKIDMKTVKKPDAPKDVTTPINTVLIKELPRSSSGRMIKPPLAYWTNQRVRHNISTDVVEIIAGSTNYLSHNTTETQLTGSTELTPYEFKKMKRTKIRELKKSGSTFTPKRRKLSKFSGSEEDGASTVDTDSIVPVVNTKQTKTRQSKQDQGGPKKQSTRTRKTRSNARSRDSMSMEVAENSTCEELAAEETNKPSNEQEKHELKDAMLTDLCKQPPAPPRKKRSTPASVSTNIPGTVRSPMYYTLSPDVTPVAIKQPVIGMTPSAAPPSVAALCSEDENKDTPRTAHLKSDALEHNVGIQLSDVKKKMKVSKVLGSSPLNLQHEVLSVILQHKQRRLAKLAKRVSKDGSLNRPEGKGFKSPDVYDLTSDESPEVLPVMKMSRAKYLTETDSDSDFTKEIKSKAKLQNGLNTSSMTINSKNSTKQNCSARSFRKNTRTRSNSAESLQNNPNNTGSSAKSRQRASRKRNNSVRNQQRTTRSSSAESQQRSVRIRASSSSSKQQSETGGSSSAEGLRRSTRNRSSSRESVRKSTRNKNRINYEQKTSDSNLSSEDEQVSSKPRKERSKKSSTKKVLQKKSARKGAKPVEIITLDSDSDNEQDKHMSSNICSTTLKLPGRQAKRIAAEKMSIVDSESSSSEMLSLKTKAKTQPNRTILRAKRSVRNTSQKKKSTEVEDADEKRQVKIIAEKENERATSQSITERSETDWSPDELAKLKSAIEAVKPDTPMYWQCVAAIVESKSAILCQQKHHESLEKVPQKATNQKKTEDKKQVSKVPVQLTAKRGTMKRKRQLRDLVEQHNQGHEADYFDSTPFKVQSKRIKISANLDSDDEDDSSKPFTTPGTGKSSKTPGSARFKTPHVRPWKLAPLSDKKTPHTSLLSPLTTANVERNHIDTYINGIKRKKKGRTLMPQSTPMIKKTISQRKAELNMEETVNQASAAGLFEAKPASDGSDSEPSDYYWSEDEQD